VGFVAGLGCTLTGTGEARASSRRPLHDVCKPPPSCSATLHRTVNRDLESHPSGSNSPTGKQSTARNGYLLIVPIGINWNSRGIRGFRDTCNSVLPGIAGVVGKISGCVQSPAIPHIVRVPSSWHKCIPYGTYLLWHFINYYYPTHSDWGTSHINQVRVVEAATYWMKARLLVVEADRFVCLCDDPLGSYRCHPRVLFLSACDLTAQALARLMPSRVRYRKCGVINAVVAGAALGLFSVHGQLKLGAAF
jgi:hypothetical protein